MGEVVGDQVNLCKGEEYCLTKALPILVLWHRRESEIFHCVLCDLPPDFLQGQNELTIIYLGCLGDIGVYVNFIDLCRGSFNISLQIGELPIFLPDTEFQIRLEQFGFPSGHEVFILLLNPASLNFLKRCEDNLNTMKVEN